MMWSSYKTTVVPSSRLVDVIELHAEDFVADTRFVAKASKEVVLSAGTVGTPHILLNSGIGNSHSLSALGIKPLVDLPSVGQNVSDQALLPNTWFVNSTDTTEAIRENATLFTEDYALWNRSHTGPFVNPGPSFISWMRLDRNASIFDRYTDPSAGLNTPHIEMVFSVSKSLCNITNFSLNSWNQNGFFGTPPPGNFLSIANAIVTPVSRELITSHMNLSSD